MYSSLQWCHNGHDGIQNHQPHDFFTQLFIQAQIKENIKAPRHWPLRRIHQWLMNSPQKGPVTRNMFHFCWCHHEQTFIFVTSYSNSCSYSLGTVFVASLVFANIVSADGLAPLGNQRLSKRPLKFFMICQHINMYNDLLMVLSLRLIASDQSMDHQKPQKILNR